MSINNGQSIYIVFLKIMSLENLNQAQTKTDLLNWQKVHLYLDVYKI